MTSDPNLRTLFYLPDGTVRELTPTSKDIRILSAPGDPVPRVEIDGQRYGIGSASEFAYLPPTEGPARIFELVALDPPTN